MATAPVTDSLFQIYGGADTLSQIDEGADSSFQTDNAVHSLSPTEEPRIIFRNLFAELLRIQQKMLLLQSYCGFSKRCSYC